MEQIIAAKKICTSLYKFYGVRLFWARRCIIHENSSTLTRDKPPLSVLSSPVTSVVVRCAFNGRVGRCVDWEQGQIGRDTKRSDVIVGTKEPKERRTKKNGGRDCTRGYKTQVSFESFRDSRELSRASISLQK